MTQPTVSKHWRNMSDRVTLELCFTRVTFCLFVILTVCNFTDLHENFIRDVSLDNGVTFWKSSASWSGSRNFFEGLLNIFFHFHDLDHISAKKLSGSSWKFYHYLDEGVPTELWKSFGSRFALAGVFALRVLLYSLCLMPLSVSSFIVPLAKMSAQ